MKRIVTIIFLLLALSLLSGCSQTQLSVPDLIEPVGVRVATAVVQRDTVCLMKTYSATVVPHVEQVCFGMDGNFGEYLVELGDWVEKGQILATLNVESDKALINSYQQQINEYNLTGSYDDRQMTAEIEIAKAQLEILREQNAPLYDCSMKQLQIQTLEADLKQAQELRRMELDKIQTSLEKVQQRVDNSALIAPISGRVVYVRPASGGSAVNTSLTFICIADDTRLTLQTNYIEQKELDKADRVYAKIADQDADISYLPYDLTEYIQMTLSGQKMKIHFSLDTPVEMLESGQHAQIIALHDYKEDVLTIPVNTLYRDRMGRHVYKLVDGNWVRCSVTVGVITDTKVEILEGLSEGDVVRGSE